MTSRLDAGDPAKMPGHWLLAQMGKTVLRPGGLALTNSMLDGLDPTTDDQVVEFAPGLGVTTRLLLDHRPASYVGVERDEQAADHVGALLRARPDSSDAYRCLVGTAQQSGLPDDSATLAFGEAFLTMQSDETKLSIVREAFRILQPGGRYGLHELSLHPETLDRDHQDQIRGDLTRSIHVGARPLTVEGWRSLLEEAGFEISHEATVTMGLLHPRRVLADEGIVGTARILFNVARNRVARARILAMRATFRSHADHLGAVALVAIKPGQELRSGLGGTNESRDDLAPG